MCRVNCFITKYTQENYKTDSGLFINLVSTISRVVYRFYFIF